MTKVPHHDAEIEFIERKSRFIGNVFLVSSEAEAKERIEEVELLHDAASHVVYAYDIHSENATRFTDAGEPKGTAGPPVYEVFRREGLTNYCCTVTRYFGGILLGAGGLIRAYANTAKLALDAAGIAELMPYPRYRIECEYAHYDIIRAFLKNIEHEQGQPEFGAKISFDILLPESEAERMQEGLRGRTSGQVKITLLGVEQVPVKIR
ncbi:MAG: YigZ family protein [Oscillospiraceae bacterium]|nr:YigZ family protein [Oscillospiraceae bacterium]